MRECNIGGQAVIEGVMMRNPEYTAIAVRKPNKAIHLFKAPTKSLTKRFKFLKLPLLRGVVALIESMSTGIKAISYSARVAGVEEEELTGKDIIFAVVVAIFFAVVVFMIVPTVITRYLSFNITSPVILNLIEGIIRVIIFLLYVVSISRMKDIRRVFEYHGAEHKVIHCYEAGKDLNVENVKEFSTLHPRCGTGFLMIVMVVSILLFSFFGWPDLIKRIVSRIVLLPLVAGISYEVIKLAGRSQNFVIKTIITPGLWLQKLTTREPDEDQIRVAIKALKGIIDSDNQEVKENA